MLYLASKSPRRQQLLGQLGIGFRLVDVDVPEQRGVGEAPDEYVRRVARDKALAGLDSLAGEHGAIVLGADTEVVLDDEVFGKPVDDADAADMLRRLSGRTHSVVSAVCLVAMRGNGQRREAQSTCISQVTMAELDAGTIASYLTTGEHLGKAGGYAIQGAAQTFISHLAGSYSGVMGLPIFETGVLMRDFGLLSAAHDPGARA